MKKKTVCGYKRDGAVEWLSADGCQTCQRSALLADVLVFISVLYISDAISLLMRFPSNHYIIYFFLFFLL